MPWTKESIAALKDIDLALLAGDAAVAHKYGMNPYGDKAVADMIEECDKRSISTIFDDDGKAHQLSELAYVKSPRTDRGALDSA